MKTPECLSVKETYTCRSFTEIPAGTMDKENESPEECAQRELAEEIVDGKSVIGIMLSLDYLKTKGLF
jgi:hypothetical protein